MRLNMNSYLFINLQKQPFADVLQNRCFQRFSKIHRKILVLESLFNKVADLKAVVCCQNIPDGFFFLKIYKLFVTLDVTRMLRVKSKVSIRNTGII